MATREPGRSLQSAVFWRRVGKMRLIRLNMDERKVEVNEDARLGVSFEAFCGR